MSFSATGAPNINAVWCGLLVDELQRLGVRDVAVSPGSRNTPLIAALVAAETLRITSIVDERAAGFFALGCAKTGRPACVVTTSGTAVMNLIPAVTEALQSSIPLIVLSADRPLELRDCGANQTIDQLGPLEPIVKWQHDLAAPDDSLPATTVLTAVHEAVRSATTDDPGPVQLNCAFREPLAPTVSTWNVDCMDGVEAWLENAKSVDASDREADLEPDFEPIVRQIASAQKGLIVAGNTRNGNAILPLAEKLGWPILADASSSLPLETGTATVIRHADLLLGLPEPDCVLQFGGRLTSRRVQEWLDGLPLERTVIDPTDAERNPGRVALQRIVADVELVARKLTASAEAPAADDWLSIWRAADARVAAVVEKLVDESSELSEAFVARHVARHSSRLFAGNSLSIRHLDLLAPRDAGGCRVETSRGASGIDGIVATACGVATGTDEAITLLIGDLSLLHDLNSLVLASRCSQKVTIVLLNNGGGAIFQQLPIAAYPKTMSPLCDAPHDLEFAAIAGQLGLNAWCCSMRDDFEVAWEEAAAEAGSCLIEVICEPRGHAELMNAVRERIADE